LSGLNRISPAIDQAGFAAFAAVVSLPPIFSE